MSTQFVAGLACGGLIFASTFDATQKLIICILFVVAFSGFNFNRLMDKFRPRLVSFDGRQASTNGNNECLLFCSRGIKRVVREAAGIYRVEFDYPLKDNNYVVNVTQNMLNTEGKIVGFEGNNRNGENYYHQTNESIIEPLPLQSPIHRLAMMMMEEQTVD